MKKFFYLLLGVCLIPIFSSCEDDEINASISDAVGTYSGTLTALVDNQQISSSQGYVTIEEGADNSVSVKFENLNLKMDDNLLALGDLSFPNLQVEQNGNQITILENNSVVEHPREGKMDVKLNGSLNDSRSNVSVSIYSYKLDKTIVLNFAGEKMNSTPDLTDYAMQVTGYYLRESMSIKGDSVGSTWPSGGIEIEYSGVNYIRFKSFYLSFPNTTTGKDDTRQIKIDSIPLTINGNEIVLGTMTQKVPKVKQDTADLILSGKIINGSLTLNMQLTTPGKNAVYVYKGSLKSLESDILSMTFDDQCISIQPEIESGTASSRKIQFYYKAGTTPDKLNLAPIFKISAGATLYLKGQKEPFVAGTLVDFSKPQSFQVKPESGSKTITYAVTAVEWSEFTFQSALDVWEVKTPAGTAEHLVYEEPIGGWSTSNEGVKFIKMFFPALCSKDDPYPVTKGDGVSGIGVVLKSIDTKGQAGGGFMPAVPKVTSGTVFSGAFVVDIKNTLKSTKFGYPCTRKPLKFTGSYKFKAGEKFYVCANPVKADEVVLDSLRKDAPGINAVLYEVNSYAFDFLDGTNLATARNVVAIATLKDESEKENFTSFDLPFEYLPGKQYDSTKRYKLAVVCSSSKWGDQFTGAPGSTLIVDDLKVHF